MRLCKVRTHYMCTADMCSGDMMVGTFVLSTSCTHCVPLQSRGTARTVQYSTYGGKRSVLSNSGAVKLCSRR